MGLKREDCERLLASSEPLQRKIPLVDMAGKKWEVRCLISGIHYSLEERCAAILDQLGDKAIAARVFTRDKLARNAEKSSEQGKDVFDFTKFYFVRGLSAMDAVEFIGLYGSVDIAPIVASYQAKLVKAEEARKTSEQAAKDAADKLAANVNGQSTAPVDIGTPADAPSTDNGKPETVNSKRGRKPATV